MDMSSLFPSDSGLGSVLSARPSPHVSFKAGVMNRDETTNMVTADERKGVFQLLTSPEDNLLHLQWRTRNVSTIDHDLILFPAETEMKLVTSAPASARVYVLMWKEADKRMFFWMQGKDPTKDEDVITDVNNILANGPDNAQASRALQPPAPPQPMSPTPTRATAAPESDVVMQPPPAQPSVQPQPEQPARPPSTPPAPATSSSFQPITLDQMRAALPTRTGSPPSAATAALAEAQRELVLTTPSLVELLNPETLRNALSDERLEPVLRALLQYLPEQDRSVERIPEILRSPPLRAQAAALTQALQSGQAAELIRSFELPATQRLGGYSLREFLDALVELERAAKEERE